MPPAEVADPVDEVDGWGEAGEVDDGRAEPVGPTIVAFGEAPGTTGLKVGDAEGMALGASSTVADDTAVPTSQEAVPGVTADHESPATRMTVAGYGAA